jgi:hypothetical protein
METRKCNEPPLQIEKDRYINLGVISTNTPYKPYPVEIEHDFYEFDLEHEYEGEKFMCHHKKCRNCSMEYIDPIR